MFCSFISLVKSVLCSLGCEHIFLDKKPTFLFDLEQLRALSAALQAEWNLGVCVAVVIFEQVSFGDSVLFAFRKGLVLKTSIYTVLRGFFCAAVC